ncbi:unnamed protein product [Adineta ricciae]|uniref:Damage-control phosphatase ARMT1 n=1 Tax=Adineta ricciae TaxID=249248 RepID=A0A815P4Q2_ADIRI|nr:unnamed protein product [Adineta ricciae]
MIPFRGDQFDHFNNGQPVNRHMIRFPEQQQHLVQPAQLMYQPPPVHSFPQSYSNNVSIQQQQQPLLMFIPTRPRPPQPWIHSSPPVPPSLPAPITSVSASQFAFQHIQPPQPSFSGGTGSSHTSFSNMPNPPQHSFGAGTGIPQPSFSGGTALLKRKSHYLEESDVELPPHFNSASSNELPSLMGISTPSYNNQQHRFRPAHPRMRFPPSGESFNTQLSNPNWNSSDLNTYFIPPQMPPVPPMPPPQPIRNEQQLLTSQLFQKHQLIPIDSILKEPGRSQRPPQIIIFMRGLPGSGKSYVADLIKNEEELQSKGSNKPKILSIDNYFITENQQEIKDPKTGKIVKTSTMEYEYDSKIEETYRKSLLKQVRKSIDDRFYPFLIVDQNNEQLVHFREVADYAEANQFQVYFVELNNDVNSCAQRNIHKRSSDDIRQIQKCWEQLPLRYEILDIRSLLQSDAIDEVEMDDAPPPTEVELNEVEDEEEDDSQITKKSKWETMMETNPDRLDGVYQRRNSSAAPSSPPIEKRLNNTTISIDEQANELSPNLQSKKKKVRWADAEESALHLHKKAVGFVVGQTEQDWQRMSDDYDPNNHINKRRVTFSNENNRLLMAYPPPLSAKDEKSFAYETIKDRLPLIVTKIVDFLARHRSSIAKQYGEVGENECKSCIGAMDKLRYEIARDKLISLLNDNHTDDLQIWNECLQKEIDQGKVLSWFQSSWLLVECYMYRKIAEAFYSTKYLQHIDPFFELKQRTFYASVGAINVVLAQLNVDIEPNIDVVNNKSTIEQQFYNYMEISLWGNQCDLSLSGGAHSSQEHDPFHQITELKSHILINHATSVFNYLVDQQAYLLNFDVSVDFVLDNAGFELLTDLCLADFLISKRLCSRITLYLKCLPWFVSDATKSDFTWLLEQLSNTSADPTWQAAAKRWQQYIQNGQWIVQTHRFFTLPYDYSQMQQISPELYSVMSESKLIIFKGDLNYRKLVGDLRWPVNECFETALRGFQPTSLVVLRTCKADVQLELDLKLVQQVAKLDPRWMVNGKWAVIQAHFKKDTDKDV